MSIYKNQTAARIILQTEVDFNTSTVDSQVIKYKKPSGATGSWTATKLTGGETLGKIYVDFGGSVKFDEEGIWELWAYLTFSDGRVAPGEVINYTVPSTTA